MALVLSTAFPMWESWAAAVLQFVLGGFEYSVLSLTRSTHHQ